MTDPAPQPALRELRARFRHPVTLAGLAAATVILALVGPFDTEDRLSLPARLFFWAGMVLPGYAIGFLSDALLAQRLKARPEWVRVLITGLVTGAVVSLHVLALVFAVFGWMPPLEDLPAFVGVIIGVALVITAFLRLIESHRTAPTGDAAPPALMDRLPLEKRGPLVALSVEDHYVRIRTTRGEALILMRLGDAIRETGDTAGAQVHRSHWVAFDQVRSARREGDRAFLSMSVGPDVPVSRANIGKLKEAGLLPR